MFEKNAPRWQDDNLVQIKVSSTSTSWRKSLETDVYVSIAKMLPSCYQNCCDYIAKQSFVLIVCISLVIDLMHTRRS